MIDQVIDRLAQSAPPFVTWFLCLAQSHYMYGILLRVTYGRASIFHTVELGQITRWLNSTFPLFFFPITEVNVPSERQLVLNKAPPVTL